ncbi:hypothetical protein Tco_1381604 [Tanacetum coccineum]
MNRYENNEPTTIRNRCSFPYGEVIDKLVNYRLPIVSFATFTTTDETKGSNLGCHRKSKLSSEEKNQLLHKKKIIGFPTHRSCAPPLLNSFDTHDLIRVVPTYHQDEDDQDAHAIQDDNPAITTLIHVEYSTDENAKTETPMVIEEDEKLMVFTSTKVHELLMENKSIDPKEVTNILSSMKENQHQIVFVHQESLDEFVTTLYKPLLSHGASRDKRAKRVKLQN